MRWAVNIKFINLYSIISTFKSKTRFIHIKIVEYILPRNIWERATWDKRWQSESYDN